MILVQSSNLAAYDYDPETKVLSIQFKNNPAMYDYFDVPQAVVDAFAQAESKGRYFYSEIKSKYRVEKR